MHNLEEHVPELARYWWLHHKIPIGRFSCEGAEALNKTVKEFLTKHNNNHFNGDYEEIDGTRMLRDNVVSSLVHR